MVNAHASFSMKCDFLGSQTKKMLKSARETELKQAFDSVHEELDVQNTQSTRNIGPPVVLTGLKLPVSLHISSYVLNDGTTQFPRFRLY